MNDSDIADSERDNDPEWVTPLRHDWSLRNILSDQTMAILSEPRLRPNWRAFSEL